MCVRACVCVNYFYRTSKIFAVDIVKSSPTVYYWFILENSQNTLIFDNPQNCVSPKQVWNVLCVCVCVCVCACACVCACMCVNDFYRTSKIFAVDIALKPQKYLLLIHKYSNF